MATFYSLLSFMAVDGFEYSDSSSFDMISNLPTEIAIIVLRMLPGKDLINTACVNKNWFNICKSDCKLRQKIRRYLRQQRKTEIVNRLFAARRTNSRRNVMIRPAMTNVLNAADARNVREIRSFGMPQSSRYMPYRRDSTFLPTSRVSSRPQRQDEKTNPVRSWLRV